MTTKSKTTENKTEEKIELKEKEFNTKVIDNINFEYGYPGPSRQNLTGDLIMNNLFFQTQYEFLQIQRAREYDYIVIGTGPCSYSFMSQMFKNNPKSRILCVERGQFFLPEHFQNLPLAFSTTVGINGITETYPWTLSYNTVNNKNGYIKFQRGQLPIFGGRSVIWSAWCPRPTEKLLENWPRETRKLLLDNNGKVLKRAEELLHVIPSNKINKKSPNDTRPVYLYGEMQDVIYTKLEKNISKFPVFNRLMYAPLAVAQPNLADISFEKFSTCGPMLSLIQEYGNNIDIVTNTTVEKIISQKVPIHDDEKLDQEKVNRIITGLKTSRGNINIKNAKLILGMSNYPAATLVKNSFPSLKNVGTRLSCHFISSITARIRREHFGFKQQNNTEIGAIYIAGADKIGQEFHIQLSIISDTNPEEHAFTLFRYAPDVVATASELQLKTSGNYIVFVCAVLGELDHQNKNNWFKLNENYSGSDLTKNMLLQILENKKDLNLWDTMDCATFNMLEDMLIDGGKEFIEYWHPRGTKGSGDWVKQKRPSIQQRRVPGVVHESSLMHIGNDKDAKCVVDVNYKLKGVENTYVTGASLWPRGGSWNPTLTMCALAQDLADKLSK